MRKFKLISLALLSITFGGGVAFAIDTPPEPGDIKRITGASQDTTYRAYKLVRRASQDGNAATLSADTLVVWDQVSDDGITITETTVSGDGGIAGIVVTNIQTSDNPSATTSSTDDVGRRNWGYIQVQGKSQVRILAGGSNGHSAGDAMITSTDAGRACTYELLSVDTSNITTTARAQATQSALRRQFQAKKGGFFLDAANGTKTTEEVVLDLQ